MLQAFLITFCGAVLAFFGCLGDTIIGGGSQVGEIAFIVGLAAFLGGGLLTVFLAFRILWREITGKRQSEPPAPPTRPEGE